MPEVSIIIPVYNSEKYLGDCLQSVRNQSYTDFEVLCVNDGSIDSSGKIIDEFCELDKRFRHIKQENQGISGARNTGIELSQGKYIYFCDSDDILHFQLLASNIYFIEKYQADFVSFRHLRFSDDQVHEQKFLEIDKIPFQLSNEPIKHIWTKPSRNPFKIKSFAWSRFFKKSFMGDSRFEVRTFEDIPFNTKILSKVTSIIMIDAALYFYRVHPESLSTNYKLSHIKDQLEGLFLILNELEGHPHEHILKKKLGRRLIAYHTAMKKNLSQSNKGAYTKAFELGLIKIEPYGLLKRQYIRRRYLYIFLLMLWKRKTISLFSRNQKNLPKP